MLRSRDRLLRQLNPFYAYIISAAFSNQHSATISFAPARYDRGASAVERRLGPGHNAMVCVLADRRTLPRIVSFRYAVRMEWIYNSLSEADDTTGIARLRLDSCGADGNAARPRAAWCVQHGDSIAAAGHVTASRRGRGRHAVDAQHGPHRAHAEWARRSCSPLPPWGGGRACPIPGSYSASARNRHGNKRSSMRIGGGATPSDAAAVKCFDDMSLPTSGPHSASSAISLFITRLLTLKQAARFSLKGRFLSSRKTPSPHRSSVGAARATAT